MKSRGVVSMLLCGGAVFGAAGVFSVPGQVETLPVEPPAVGRAVSGDKQFVVYAKDLRTRAALVEAAERAKADYQSLLLRGADWVFPIVLQTRAPQTSGDVGPAIRERLFHTNDGYRLQLDIELGERFRSDAFRDALITMLMMEQALRGVEGDPPPAMIPRWLAAGVPEAIRFRAEGEPSTLFASIFNTGRMLSVEEILEATGPPANSVTEAVYRVSACGFVQLLLDQASGPAQLGALISGLGVPSPSMADRVARYFPGLRGSNEKLEKWWALQASVLARPGIFELMGPEETDRAIEEALQLDFWEAIPVQEPVAEIPAAPEDGKADTGKNRWRFSFWKKREKEIPAENQAAPAETGAQPAQADTEPERRAVSCHVRELDRYMAREDRARILLPTRRRLTELSFRSYPMHRAVLEDYKSLLTTLADGRMADAPARLEALEWERKAILERVEEISDYLNWHSATQTGDRSGAFERYLERSRAMAEPQPRRKDRISGYLDGMEDELRRR